MSKYLYNGILLPKLPSWMTDVLPYACIQYIESGAIRFYSLIAVSAAGKVITDDFGAAVLQIEADTLIQSIWNVAADDASANELASSIEGINATEWVMATDSAEDADGIIRISNVVWTNTPLCYEDGAVYMEASEPKLYAIRIDQTANIYRYNGVRLPALPKWNQDMYPYAILYYFEGDDGAIVAHFGYSDRPYYLNTLLGVVTNPDGAAIYASAYDSESRAWGDLYQFEDASFALQQDEVIWTNVDVHDDYGAMILEATEPIPVIKFALQEWLNWFVAGLCSQPQTFEKSKPVAYLYNGERLPLLPDGNMEEYPCVTVITTIGTTYTWMPKYTVYFTKVPMVANPNNYHDGLTVANNEAGSSKYNPPNDTDWSAVSYVGELNYIYGNAVWANYDLMDKSGDVYLATSEPVPVYG